MIFIILIALGAIGIVGTIWVSSASLRWAEHPVAPGDEWYAISPERIESGLVAAIQTRTREILKVILKWAIQRYRETERKITVKQEIKKRVRAFLYDHRNDIARNPSAVWGQLKHDKKDHSADIAPNEIISGDQ